MLLAVLSLAAAAPPAAPGDELVDSVVAHVGRRVITKTEVELEAAVLLVQQAGEAGLAARIDGQFFRRVLDTMIVQELLDIAARRRGMIAPEADVAKAMARFALRFSGMDRYRAFLVERRVSEEEIRAILRRSLRVDALLQDEFSVRPVRVTEAEQQERGPGGAAAAADLLEAKRSRRIQQLADEQRSKVTVRVLLDEAP